MTGVAVALGYGLGALLQRAGGWVLRRFGVQVPVMPVARKTFGLVLAIGFVLATMHATELQRWTYARLGLDDTEGWWARIGTIAVATAVVLLAVGLVKGINAARGRVTWLADKVLPRWIAAGVATVLVLWFVAFSLNNWVYQRTLNGLNETFTLSDGIIAEGQEPPTSSLRSTGPASKVVWEETGREGRRFLTSGPSVDELAELTPSDEAIEPVRVFVGREQEQDAEARAALALDELERFGAFEREAVAVVIPTGTGWINEQIVQPLEYFHAGDVAIVWWDWPVLNREPDWLNEPLDEAVNPAMQWYPVSTFLNLAVDMAVATAFDEGQGHMYGTQPALAWHLMLDPEGWDTAHMEALLERLETVPRSI